MKKRPFPQMIFNHQKILFLVCMLPVFGAAKCNLTPPVHTQKHTRMRTQKNATCHDCSMRNLCQYHCGPDGISCS
jgi:hypothetical protein